MTKSVMERSHAKLTQWAMAFYLYASSKKGFTAHQLQRELGLPVQHRLVPASSRHGSDAPWRP